MLLSHDDLRELSGRKRPKEIRAWLRENGIPFRTRPDGWPSITWRIYENAVLQGRTTSPDFSAFRKAG